MIRTALMAWVLSSIPCSVLLGRLCRGASLPLQPLAGHGGEPLSLASLGARAAR